MPNDLVTQGNKLTQVPDNEMPLVIPYGMVGSDISGVKPSNREVSMLFIGGPLDGRMVRVPADGRLYDHHKGMTDTYRYIPSVISFQGVRRGVYILMERLIVDPKPAIVNENQKRIKSWKD